MGFSSFLIGADTLLLECGDRLISKGHSIRGIITDADKVRDWCESRNIRCIELESDYLPVLQAEPFDYLFAITHLAIIKDEVLELPKKAAINFHDGPLPRYAGLNAPAWALMKGEREYGISWHLMTAGVDEGDILKQRLFPLAVNETSLTLNTRNFEVAIETFQELIEELAADSVTRTPQSAEGRSIYRRSDRPEHAAFLDWNKPADELEALVRGLDFGQYPNPLTVPKVYTASGRALAVVDAEAVSNEACTEAGVSLEGATPGRVMSTQDGVWISTARGALVIKRLSKLNGKAESASLSEMLGATVGEALPSLPTELVNALETHQTRLAKAETFWSKRLTQTQPASVSMAQPDKAFGERTSKLIPWPEGVPQTAAVAAAAVGLYLGRSSGASTLAVGFQADTQRSLATQLPNMVSPVVPLRLGWDAGDSLETLLATTEKEFERLEKQDSYWSDLVARTPELRSRNELAWGEGWQVVIRTGDDALSQVSADSLLDLAVTSEGVHVRYHADAFKAGDIQAQLQAALAAFKSPADSRCGSVSLLSGADRETVLQKWNSTQEDVSTSCVHQLFEAQVERTPDRNAVIFAGAPLTYAQLNQKANGLAAQLVQAGVKPDQLVGVMVNRSANLVVATLGVMKAGGAYVPLDPDYPEDRVAYMLKDSGAQVVVTERALADRVPEGVTAIMVEDIQDQESNPETGVSPENLAYVIYTSGSTGMPKGVMVEHRNVINFFAGMDPVIAKEQDNVWLSVTSLSFDISVLELFWTLARGFTIVLYRDPNKHLAKASLTPGKNVDFSLFLWGADDKVSDSKYELMLHAARFGDEKGFAAIWTPERHFHAFGGPYPNPSVTSAAIASITKNIGIRSGSCVVTLHHPVRVAEEWAVVDNISHGRVGMAFASGWQPDDFLLKPENFKDNKKVLVDYIDKVRRLWRGEALEFENPLGKQVKVTTQPRPIQDELPYWVTAAGNPETFRIAGEEGANMLTHLLGQDIKELADKIKIYRQARADAGYDPDTGTVTLMLHTYVGEDDATVRERARQPMKDYLNSSLNLVKGFAWAFPAFKRPKKGGGEELDLEGLSEEDIDTILEFAFERYYENSGLFGTVDACLATVEKVRAIGVDDIACLIDYGIPTEQVKEGLIHLAKLKERVDAELSKPVTQELTDSRSLGELVSDYNVTHMQCTPSLMTMALGDEQHKSSILSIPHVMLGGEALPLQLAKEVSGGPAKSLTNMYGPTETTIWSSTHKISPEEDTVPIGRPISNTQLYVLDAGLEPVPIGVPGELYIGGHGVVRGYHQRPELTDERFVKDPFKAGNRMYKTGDLVRWRQDGVLEFLGRTDHQVKIRGHRIELGEIEAAITRDADVKECVVVARQDTPGNTRLVAYLTGSADIDKLRGELRGLLPEFMVPSAFVALPRLPHTPNGKVDRKALPAPDSKQQAAASKDAVQPESELEQQVAGLWQEVLGLDAVGTTDNFFDLGGHSLLVVRLHQLLKQALDPSIPMTAIYRFPTIRGFVASLDKGQGSATAKQALDRGQSRREQMAKRRASRARVR